MRDEVERAFGAVPSPPVPSRPVVNEPEQTSERRVELRKAGGHELLIAAYKAPARDHPDSYALDVLAHVLGQGRLSRLYRRLVEPGFAVQTEADNQIVGADPFLFVIDVEPAREIPAERVSEILDEEIALIGREGIRTDELERARKRARVGFILRRARVSSRTFLIGESEVLGSWHLLEGYLDQLDRVTVESVAEAARRYLSRGRRTWARFVPEAQASREATAQPGQGGGA